ncbi:MAG: hypothetical protein WC860_09685 [Candidatus Margulisiibacteriota bacterium]|jgi:hypothetical protein
MNKKMVSNIMEFFRIGLTCLGIYLGYYFYRSNPVLGFQLASFLTIISLAGLTGLEGLFLSQKASLENTGYLSGRAYQRQSALNNLAIALATIFVFLFNWGFFAIASLLIVLLIFLALSGLNHGYSAFYEKNTSIKNFLRPFITIILITAIIPIMINAYFFIK